MMKYITTIAVLLMLAGCGAATIWLWDDQFFQTGSASSVTQLADVSALQIIESPYFTLLGQSFYKSAIPYRLVNSSNAVQIGSEGTGSLSPLPVTFGGHLEDNMRYAQSKSSLRVGQQGSWVTVSAPGAL
ncbi:MAG TPA: hypothetical protein PLN19_03925 [Methanothrix sp.]|nr:hypothetical protein [Methanothrix sp.]HOV81599.1 hypothetical protein [Methanothrix sp.]HPC89610.1 hypothetical protein [Methanothrix sp.]HQE87403.1 hypothetical protein [Methanothrix sp.]HQI67939.1 hypothetical protein [Methanothrix sp.]